MQFGGDASASGGRDPWIDGHLCLVDGELIEMKWSRFSNEWRWRGEGGGG